MNSDSEKYYLERMALINFKIVFIHIKKWQFSLVLINDIFPVLEDKVIDDTLSEYQYEVVPVEQQAGDVGKINTDIFSIVLLSIRNVPDSYPL